MKWLYLISILILLEGIFLLLIIKIKNKNRKKINLTKNESAKYAIIIPARNESKVIDGLLNSIKDNNVSFNDVYIVIEDENDETVNIADKYGANIFVRKDLEERRRKGFALDDIFKYLIKEHSYDLYFIFDADNILDKNYINEMIKTYKNGYKIATGYRNIKNSKNVITSCSGLTFSMINTLINKQINKMYGTIIISGTGYYITNDLIEAWQGFPFNTLTEDYELSLYASANNISTYYNELAEFSDEQPLDMKTSIKQRTRWVSGFFEARKKRLKDVTNDLGKLLGVTPIILILISVLFSLIFSIIKVIKDLISGNMNYIIYLKCFLIIIVLVYISLFIFTLIILMKEKKRLNISTTLKIKTLLFNPIFLLTYIICLFKAITTNVTWETIDHGK